MDSRGEQVFGIAHLDGNAASGVEMNLFLMAGGVSRTLGDDEFLSVTDMQVSMNQNSEVYVDVDRDGDNAHDDEDTLFHAHMGTASTVVQQFLTHYQYPVGLKPKLYGANNGHNSLKIHGYITKA